jgi:hypothetical protein
MVIGMVAVDKDDKRFASFSGNWKWIRKTYQIYDEDRRCLSYTIVEVKDDVKYYWENW